MINSIIIYSILNFLLLFLCAKISYKLNLVDIPNKRKIHSYAIANTGGLAISVILLFALQLFELFDFSNQNLNMILSIAFLISIVGFIDDKYNLNAGGKLSLQIIPIFYLIVFENITLTHIGEYGYFKLELGAFKIPFTLFCVLLLINTFNYFDGMDGILSFASISVLAILYFLISDENIRLLFIIISIPIGFFLLFNFSFLNLPKLFLGDGGSLLLGFIISFILIFLANQNFIHPILLAWSIAIFVYEFLSLNLIRIKNKEDPFRAGQDHLHHMLFNKTNSIFFTNFLISLGNIFLFIIGYLSFVFINPLTSFILFILIFLIFLILRNKYSKNKIKIKII